MTTITPDPEPRNSRFHKKIVEATRLPQYKQGHLLKLECGHEVVTFGRLELANGIVRCDQCRQAERKTD